MMWERRSKLFFWSTVILSGFLLTQLALFAAQAGSESPPLYFNLFQLCTSWLRSAGLYAMANLLYLLAACTLVHGLWLAVRQLRLSRSTLRGMKRLQDHVLTERLSLETGMDRRHLIVTGHSGPLAVTIGFLRPVVVVSAGLVKLMDREELRAVLLHEEYHRLERHPLKGLLTLLFSSALWYVPVLSCWHRYYKITQEVLADKYAIMVAGQETSLGSALLKLVRQGGGQEPSAAWSAFADTSVNYRIKHILDPHSDLPLHLPWRSKLISSAVIIGLSSLFLTLGS